VILYRGLDRFAVQNMFLFEITSDLQDVNCTM